MDGADGDVAGAVAVCGSMCVCVCVYEREREIPLVSTLRCFETCTQDTDQLKERSFLKISWSGNCEEMNVP